MDCAWQSDYLSQLPVRAFVKTIPLAPLLKAA